jgi:hypothetical protein
LDGGVEVFVFESGLSSIYVSNRGVEVFVFEFFTLSPNHNANFFRVISGVEKVSEWVDI